MSMTTEIDRLNDTFRKTKSRDTLNKLRVEVLKNKSRWLEEENGCLVREGKDRAESVVILESINDTKNVEILKLNEVDKKNYIIQLDNK